MDGSEGSKAYNVVRGVMVAEEPTGLFDINGRLTPLHSRRSAVAYRVTSPTCRHCGGEDGCHLLVGKELCRNWRPFGIATVREQFETRVADMVGRRPENIEALAATLKQALHG